MERASSVPSWQRSCMVCWAAGGGLLAHGVAPSVCSVLGRPRWGCGATLASPGHSDVALLSLRGGGSGVLLSWGQGARTFQQCLGTEQRCTDWHWGFPALRRHSPL